MTGNRYYILACNDCGAMGSVSAMVQGAQGVKVSMAPLGHVFLGLLSADLPQGSGLKSGLVTQSPP